MKAPHMHPRSARWARKALSLVLACAPVAYAVAPVPAQVPLLSKPAAGALPNIMLTMDDSGSLSFRHMPEDKFASDTFATTNPVGSNTVRWDMSDTYQTGVNFAGTVPGDVTSTNYVARALRATDTNSIYYNPEIRYQPWLQDDGVSRRPNSPISAAYMSPPLKATTATSVTSILVATGSKVFTLNETGKAFTVGQNVVISSTANATNWMAGSITAFNAGTGAMTVNVTAIHGTGTLTSWNVVQTATIDLTTIIPTGTFTAGSFIPGQTYKVVNAGTTNFSTISSPVITAPYAGKTFTATAVGTGSGTASGAGTLTGWCYANASVAATGSGGCASATGAFHHDPGVYFRLAKTTVTKNASQLVAGSTYTILTAGTTSFTAVGALNNNVGTVFTATGPGTGTGTATLAVYAAVTDYTKYTPFSVNTVPAGKFVNGTVYQITVPGTTSFTAIGAANNLVGTIFTATGAGTGTGTASIFYTKYPNRLDCAGTQCTGDEERQNFANWYSYYRDRNLMARGAMMEAFGPEGYVVTAGSFVVGSKYSIVSTGTTSFTAIGAASNAVGTVFTATGVGTGTGTASAGPFRLGFGRINKGSASVDGVNTAVIESDTTNYGGGGVRDFNATRRIQLFKWLEDLPASGGTPLVEALKADGDYYSRTDSRSPWTNDPSTTNTVANNLTCRRSYTILTTDGYWNGPGVSVGNADNTAGSIISGSGASYQYAPIRPYLDGSSNTLADVAMYYWKKDLQTGMNNDVTPVGDNISFWQNMTTFTVGLGVRGTLDPALDLPALTAGTKSWPAAGSGQTAANVDDLWHAAVNSRGKYFSAKDPKELSDSVRTAIGTATESGNPQAGVATASTVLSTSNRKYVPGFSQIDWSGDIVANPIDENGAVTAQVWSAKDRMPPYGGRDWSGRNIVTWDTATSTAVSFNWASISAAGHTAMGPVALANTTNFINFLKGDHSMEVPGPFRLRKTANGTPFMLGDFVNANPVLVADNVNHNYTALGLGGSLGVGYDPTYADYQIEKAKRTTTGSTSLGTATLFAGSNDGMLHAFIDTKGRTAATALTDGEEVFAYVPGAVYPNLYKLADPTYGQLPSGISHQYFVDGPLTEADAFVPGPGDAYSSWRNYLMGSLGAGGKAVFALDVTFLQSLGTNSVRWEITDTDMGYVLSPIKVGVLPNGRWVAIFGNGFSSTNGYATLFVVDIQDAASTDAVVRAAAVHKLNVDTNGGNGLGGVTLVHDTLQRVIAVYVGDLQGQMWKLDYNNAASAYFSVSGTGPLFTAKDGLGNVQPITASPVVYNHSQGGQIVLFGTGQLFATADQATTSAQSVYAVWDKPSDAMARPLVRSKLQPRTLSTFAGTGGAAGTTFVSVTGTAVNWSTQRGWYTDFTSILPGGRVIYPTQVLNFATALVSAVAPVQGTPAACDSPKGSGLNLILNVESGLLPAINNVDSNGDGVADTAAAGYATNADGIDAILKDLHDADGGDRRGGDCTGADCQPTCITGAQACTQTVLCGANACLNSIQSSSSGTGLCTEKCTNISQPASTRTYDRAWRRIINPPIR